MEKPGFNLYLLFIISWFLHLGTRIPVLGIIRFELLLVIALAALAVSATAGRQEPRTEVDTLLRVLIAYAVLTIPLVEWPGSVIRSGLEALVKAAVFYYFTIAFVESESRLEKLILVFVGCQIFRVMGPLYLHLTDGYWGSFASMGDWEYLDRLSGAPSDVVNPNGLAFVVCTVLPFLYFAAGLSKISRLAFLLFAPYVRICLDGDRVANGFSRLHYGRCGNSSESQAALRAGCRMRADCRNWISAVARGHAGPVSLHFCRWHQEPIFR